MNARDFCFWLQGCFEMNPNLNALDERQTEMLKQHLHLVFTHEIGPSFGDENYQDKLKEVHESPASPKHDPMRDGCQAIPAHPTPLDYKPFFPAPVYKPISTLGSKDKGGLDTVLLC